ncbi:hypothetical protein [Micromonospora avicenniae]|uniref:hypothetical protein n=1 Tax=Micromonospora avicenniae TaxID=1198245 RepID=UPI00331BD727
MSPGPDATRMSPCCSAIDRAPQLISLARWGAHQPAPQGATMSTDAFMLLFKALYRPPAGAAPELTVRLLAGVDTFNIVVRPTEVNVNRGGEPAGQATVRADVPTLWALIFTDRTVAAAVDAGDAEVTGDREAAQQFFRLFGI